MRIRASRSSRRWPAAMVSGQNETRCSGPPGTRQERKASGPRQSTRSSSMATPLHCARPWPVGISNVRGGRWRWRLASNAAQPIAASAKDQATPRGRSEASSENGASNASDHAMAPTQRDGRHSMRQGADATDKRRDFDIGGSLVAKEPAPDPIVLAVQQPSENPALGLGRRREFPVQPAFQQLVQFPHAAAAAPAQALEISFLRRAHPLSRPTANTPHRIHRTRLLARKA